METYFLILKAKPATDNEHYGKVKGASVHFWVLDKNPQNAESRAKHYLSKYRWELVRVEQSAVEITPEQFVRKDIGSLNYRKAQKYGIAAFFSAWRDDPNNSTIEIVKL